MWRNEFVARGVYIYIVTGAAHVTEMSLVTAFLTLTSATTTVAREYQIVVVVDVIISKKSLFLCGHDILIRLIGNSLGVVGWCVESRHSPTGHSFRFLSITFAIIGRMLLFITLLQNTKLLVQ